MSRTEFGVFLRTLALAVFTFGTVKSAWEHDRFFTAVFLIDTIAFAASLGETFGMYQQRKKMVR